MTYVLWRSLLVFATSVVVRGLHEYTDQNGILHVNEALAIRPGRQKVPMRNARFPDEAPAMLLQIWRFVAYPDGVLRVSCQHVSLPAFEDGSCGDYSLTIVDGGDKRVLCGDIGALNVLSRSSGMTMTLTTGEDSRGRVDCTVQAMEGENSPATTETLPIRPEFMTMGSEEFDSSEHGGPPGRVGTTCPCGKANKQAARIIGGSEAKMNEYPFTVLITFRERYVPFCGGSIITRRHIITAAHCVVSKENKDLAVGMGDHDFTKEFSPYRKVVNVREIISHQTYRTHKNYDVALLLLEESIEFNRNIGPVCLPSKTLILDWKYLTAIGWGRTGWNEGLSPYLKKIRVRAVPLSLCGQYTSVNVSDPHELCTFGRKRGLGQGDSGGPVVWLDPDTNRYTIVGLPSGTYEFVDQNYRPDMNTDVTSFLPWIHENIKRSDPNAIACTSLNQW